MPTTSCPKCHASEPRLLPVLSERSWHDYYRCNACGHIWTVTKDGTTIVSHVWNYGFDTGTNAVDVLVYRLRDRIDKGFDRKLLHTVRGVGYVLKVD